MLDWYLQAIRRTKPKNGRHEHVLEPIYNFCSALVKFLYQGKMDASTVLVFLNKEKSLQQASSLKQQEDGDSDVVYMGSSADTMSAVPQEQRPAPSSAINRVSNELKMHSAHLPDDTANAYNSIFKRITEIRAADSKGWHHRPVYRVSQDKKKKADSILNMPIRLPGCTIMCTIKPKKPNPTCYSCFRSKEIASTTPTCGSTGLNCKFSLSFSFI